MNRQELRQRKDSGPYDDSLNMRIQIYDNMPYVRDINICNKESIALYSGNLIKYYRCCIQEARLIESNVTESVISN